MEQERARHKEDRTALVQQHVADSVKDREHRQEEVRVELGILIVVV